MIRMITLLLVLAFITTLAEDITDSQTQVAQTQTYSNCKVRSTDDKLVCLPDVFFIGASKAGTSTIATILFQHPMISNPRGANKSGSRRQQTKDKESHYFDHSDEETHTNKHILHRMNKYEGIIGASSSPSNDLLYSFSL